MKCFRKVQKARPHILERRTKLVLRSFPRKQKVNKLWRQCVRDKSKLAEKKTKERASTSTRKMVRHPARAGAHTSLTQRERPLLSPGAHTNKFALSAHFSRDFARGLIERDC
jgi:hypothetical protein